MKMRFFWVPARDGDREAEVLNQFLGQQRVVHVERRFHGEGAPGWAICEEWVERSGPDPVGGKGRQRVDYREQLDKESFRIFAELRKWRKEEAGRHGVPVYAVASNDQLAAVAQGRIETAAGLREVEGYGQGKVEKYGEGLIGMALT